MITQNGLETETRLSIPGQGTETGEASFQKGAMEVLQETSRTFFIPISQLPPGLQEAVASAYLCLRAIDEIEDHTGLDRPAKERLLRQISKTLQSNGNGVLEEKLWTALGPYQGTLPGVSIRLDEWLRLAPATVAPRIWDAIAAMADRMADWAACNWAVHIEADLDRYTFGVAGAVGLLLSDLWAWYDGTPTNRVYAIGFGRGLQAVNILRNQSEDLRRGVDFFPDGWDHAAMHAYARRNLGHADLYLNELPPGPAFNFCRIPLALAYATLDALAQGKSKLNRSEVELLIKRETP